MERYCMIRTPLGEMVGLVEQEHLCGLWFVGQKYAPEFFSEWRQDPDHPVFAALRGQLEAYFAGRPTRFDLPLAPRGTEFQKAVWALLRTIPPGTVTTYGALARHLGEKREGSGTSARAVGSAVGHNPISIVIPCHRVVGADGSLTGYAGGLERKAALLDLENAEFTPPRPPRGL
ncbi:methylated-DNA--[protein]-cysteine S-methyltransferase [Geobacter sp. FeAm09]|uniref:methylated-DNA--[protein]-cysteine S-methyltransferase n=1 Tax=Geobacter sp. FeAm09 TaxID=2597769 RepID=UPI0011ECB376|nr:methylated-DNA--[protein]-cysteine S-methyltransferase [Geobacter sp. FeAm09]QEM69778.1 methylated-DNA--[protein]-cysteine S-methyltransferase [Geobacter sp. FeAm09]